MLLNLLVSICCVVSYGDTLDVATVSSRRNTAVEALSPVQTMSGSRTEMLGTVGVHEVLNQFSGVSVKDYGGVGGLKTVSVRNMGASHTSVIYDGIAVSDAQNGQVDISRFNLDDIASVSLSISMEDDIFCSARHLTSAGILRLQSMLPSFQNGPTHLSTRMTFGSFGTYNPYLSLSQRLGSRYALKASLNGIFSKGDYPFIIHNGHLTTEEKRINSDVRSCGVEAGFYADWNTRGSLKAKLNFLDSERGLPGSVILYTRNAYERLWDRSAIANVMYDCDLGEKWALHADIGYSHSFNRHLDSDPAYTSPQDSRYIQNEYSFAARGRFMPNPHWTIVLADDIFVNTLDSNIPECPFPVRISNMTALSAQYSGARLRASLSLVSTYITEHLQMGEAPSDRFRLSPVAGLSWRLGGGFHLRAGYKEGYRVPTFNDLYYARVGNINLLPEKSRQINMGLTFSRLYAWGTADMTLDAYHNTIKDKIVAVPTMFIWKMRNVGAVAMYGADATASLRWKACRWLTIHPSANWSLQYALDVTDPSSKSFRHQIPYTPRHCGNSSLTFELKWFNLTYRMNAVGLRYSGSQNLPSNEMEGYVDHCIAVNRNFTFCGNQKIYIGVEGLNLADMNYEVIHGYPMPGRSFRLTIKYKY